jgi:activating signal cointegrator 1
MKVLTVGQPGATLIATREISKEARSWPTPYRGPLAIHAGRGLSGLTQTRFREICKSEPIRSALLRHGFESADALPRGAILAVTRIVDCVEITSRNLPSEHERNLGLFIPGRFMWLFEDTQTITPIAFKGALGLWNYKGADLNPYVDRLLANAA